MSTPTPGPWQAEHGDRILVNGKILALVYLIDRPGGQALTEREANTRLMAAAPRLLNALRVITLTPGILAHLEATDPMALRQARAAIAQAIDEEETHD